MLDNNDSDITHQLNIIATRLSSIEDRIAHIILIEERQKNTDIAIERIERRVYDGDNRIHDIQIAQTSLVHVDKLNAGLNALRSDMSKMNDEINVNKGLTSLKHEIFKWGAGVLAAILIYMLTVEGGFGGG